MFAANDLQMTTGSHAGNGAEAVRRLRRAGLAPTRRRMAVAVVALGGDSIPNSAEDLTDCAMDVGFCLSHEAAAEMMAEFRAAGLFDRERPALRQTADKEKIRVAARLLQAMGNPHRLAVLCELAGTERSVGQLQDAVGIQQSALSQHLARLRADGLVKTRRDSVRIFYSLADETVAAVMRGLWGRCEGA